MRAELAYKNHEKTQFVITSGSNDPFITEEAFKQLYSDLKAAGNDVLDFSHDFGHQLIQEELDFTKKVYGENNV